MMKTENIKRRQLVTYAVTNLIKLLKNFKKSETIFTTQENIKVLLIQYVIYDIKKKALFQKEPTMYLDIIIT